MQRGGGGEIGSVGIDSGSVAKRTLGIGGGSGGAERLLMDADIVVAGAETSDAKSPFVVRDGRHAGMNDLMIDGIAEIEIERETFQGFATFVGDLAEDYGLGGEFDDDRGSIRSNLNKFAEGTVVAKYCTRKIIRLGKQDDRGARSKGVEFKAAVGVRKDGDRGIGQERDKHVTDRLVGDGVDDDAAKSAGTGGGVETRLLGDENGSEEEHEECSDGEGAEHFGVSAGTWAIRLIAKSYDANFSTAVGRGIDWKKRDGAGKLCVVGGKLD